MTFLSPHFLFVFLPLSVFLYYLFPTIKLKNIVLIMISLAFYAFGDVTSIILLIFCTLMNYSLSRLIGKFYSRDVSIVLTVIAVNFNVCVLLYFKMFTTFLGGNAPTIPVGVSFFTFQCIAYIVDVYKKKIVAEKSFLNFSIFIMLFPKLISGPILRYDEMVQQIGARQHSWNLVSCGIVRFIIGLSKKVLLADLAAHLVTSNLGTAMSTPVQAWFGLLMFTFQLYFDFSGYSDMAIGLGKIFGFHFPENFNYPYSSVSISQFWRRWHITLGTFFRDYIYIPLGGNKHRHIFNLLIVWVATGIWHGFGIGFIIWGLYHFTLVVIDKKTKFKMPVVLSRIGTFFLVYFGFSFFYYPDLHDWLNFIRVALNIDGTVMVSQMNLALLINNLPFVFLCFMAATPILPWLKKYIPQKVKQPLSIGCVLFLLVVCTAFIYTQGHVPFLYSDF